MKKLKIVTRKGCKGYYLRPTEFGRTCWKFLSENKKEAERMAEDYKLQRQQKRKDGYSKGADVDLVIRSYLRSKFESSLTTKESRRRYQVVIERFRAYVLRRRVKNISDIDMSMIEEYLYGRSEDGVASKTWNMERMIVANLFKYAIARKWAKENPVKNIAPKQAVVPQVENLSEEEAFLLLRKMKEKKYKVPYYEIVATILYTGMRVNEALYLTKSDVDLERGLFVVREKTVDGRFWRPKTKEQRYVPIADDICEIIVKQMATGGDLLFQTTKGHVINNRRVLEKVADACREAGLKYVHVHSLRHTFCSIAHMRNIPETAIQEVLGHKSAAMTQRYRHLRPDFLREQFKSFGYGKREKNS